MYGKSVLAEREPVQNFNETHWISFFSDGHGFNALYSQELHR